MIMVVMIISLLIINQAIKTNNNYMLNAVYHLLKRINRISINNLSLNNINHNNISLNNNNIINPNNNLINPNIFNRNNSNIINPHNYIKINLSIKIKLNLLNNINMLMAKSFKINWRSNYPIRL